MPTQIKAKKVNENSKVIIGPVFSAEHQET
jgi:hypothetical protein